MNVAIQILAGLLIVCGAILNYKSKFFVKKFNLIDKVKIPNENEMNEDEKENYRNLKANMNLKITAFGLVFLGAASLFIILR
jgi:hypothetical protein